MMFSYAGRKSPLQPPPDEFADDLETLFAPPSRPDSFNEAPWSMEELPCATRCEGGGKLADEAGLVIELLKHAPNRILVLVLDLFNIYLCQGCVVCHPAGGKQFSPCWLGRFRLSPHQISDQLPMFA